MPAILGGPCGPAGCPIKRARSKWERECPIVLEALRAGRELTTCVALLTVAGDTRGPAGSTDGPAGLGPASMERGARGTGTVQWTAPSGPKWPGKACPLSGQASSFPPAPGEPARETIPDAWVAVRPDVRGIIRGGGSNSIGTWKSMPPSPVPLSKGRGGETGLTTVAQGEGNWGPPTLSHSRGAG